MGPDAPRLPPRTASGAPIDPKDAAKAAELDALPADIEPKLSPGAAAKAAEAPKAPAHTSAAQRARREARQSESLANDTLTPQKRSERNDGDGRLFSKKRGPRAKPRGEFYHPQ